MEMKDINVENKEYNVLMDAARTHMNAAQAYFEAARNLMMVGPDKVGENDGR